MTRKRYKRSLAALGILAAFFMMLAAVLLIPTLASAGRDSGSPYGHIAKPDATSSHAGRGAAPHDVIALNDASWNEPYHRHGTVFGGPDEFCSGGANACAGSDGGPDGGYIRIGGFGGASGGGNSPGTEGGGTPNGFGGAHFAGGFIWGGFGGGFAQGGGNPGSDPSNKDDADAGGPKVPFLDLTPPGDDDAGPLFLDDENPPAGDPPTSGNQPPLTALNTPTQVPEPLTLSLFAAGLAGTAAMRRRQRAK